MHLNLNRFAVLLWTYIFFVLNYRSSIAENVTFIPQPIIVQLSNLPEPFATPSANKGAKIISIPTDPKLYVPSGFTVKQYAGDLVGPRYLVYTPSGDLLVSEPRIHRISLLLDTNADGYPDQRMTFADSSNGLNQPYGMAFFDQYFYVGNRNATRRYRWTEGTRQISGTGEVIMTYADNGHWTRTVLVSPTSNFIFVSIGSASNVNEEPLPRASIQRANMDGTNPITFAYGIRNAVGLDFHPITKELYVSCQERDALGDDLVPDYFTRVQLNQFFGWPYAYLSPNLTDPRRRLANGTSERPDLVSLTRTPDVLFEAHSAALDILFYSADSFPEKYKNGAFVALHGSWNKNNGTGYKIVFVPFDDRTNQPKGYYEDFVYGFLTNPSGPDTFGRPVGLLMHKDGSLLFTDDGNNRIYQVQYNENANPNPDC